jgi:hypothetical protein
MHNLRFRFRFRFRLSGIEAGCLPCRCPACLYTQVLSAALHALSALSLDNPAAALDLASLPDLAHTISMVLEHR